MDGGIVAFIQNVISPVPWHRSAITQCRCMDRKTSGDQLESGGSEFRWNISEMFDVFVIIKCLQRHSSFSSSPPIPSKRIPRMILVIIIIIIRIHAVYCENNPFRAKNCLLCLFVGVLHVALAPSQYILHLFGCIHAGGLLWQLQTG